MATSSTNRTRRDSRTQAEWDTLARKVIVPALQKGTTMTDIRKQYGAGPTIRRALYRIGYTTKGAKVNRPTIKVTKAALVAARKSGMSWDQLAFRTGKPKDELIAYLNKNGEQGLTQGRVITSQRTLNRKAKAAAAEKAKPVRKPRAKKAAPKVASTVKVRRAPKAKAGNATS